MNPWLLFFAGFVAFPATILALALLSRRRVRVVPNPIQDSAQLQSSLRELLSDESRVRMLFLRDVETRLLIRVAKFVRPNTPHTLAVELRRSDSGAALYRRARAAIESRGYEFAEEFTPKRRLPRRLQLLHAGGGPFAVTFVESVISAINDALHPGRELDLLASDRQPGYWVADAPRPSLSDHHGASR